jgi:hypothetical protein
MEIKFNTFNTCVIISKIKSELTKFYLYTTLGFKVLLVCLWSNTISIQFATNVTVIK